jgi:O-methyltransferase
MNPEQLELKAFQYFEAGDKDNCLAAFEALAVGLNLPPYITELHRIYTHGLLLTRSRPLWGRRLRFISMLQYAATTLSLPGESAECGCARGLSAFCIAALTKIASNPQFTGTGFHVFDSFEGLSEPAPEDVDPNSINPNMVAGKFKFSVDLVKKHLHAFPDISFYPGWIPSRFEDVADKKFRFLNLDVDLYQPTRDALMFFYPRLVPGGLIVCDDFNWAGAKRAVEECAAALGFTYEVTPFNQAVIRAPL